MNKNKFISILDFFSFAPIIYLFFLIFISSIVLYISNEEMFFKQILIFYETILILIFLIYFIFSIKLIQLFLEIIFNYFFEKENNKIIKNSRILEFFRITFFPSIITLTFLIFYFLILGEKSWVSEIYPFNFLLVYFCYFIFLTNLFGFLIILVETYHTQRYEPIKFNIYITVISIFIISFGFSTIQISNLNSQDFIEPTYLNCSFETSSKNIFISNSTSFCSYNNFDITSNYSILWEKAYTYNSIHKKNITKRNDSFEIKFPEIFGVYRFQLFEDNKLLFQKNDLNIVSFEKYLDMKIKIKDEKKTYFIGTWVFFFASIIFLIEIEKYFKKDK